MRAASGCHGCLWRLASRQRALGPPWRFPLRQPTRPPPPAAAAKIQNDLRILTERLARINDNLARKISSRNEYDKTIQETEAAYAKVRPPCAAPPIQHGRSTCLACGRASTCTTAAATAPGGGGCVRAAAPVLVRVDHAQPTLATLATWQIMESSQTLLHVLKRESVNLTKKKQASS